MNNNYSNFLPGKTYKVVFDNENFEGAKYSHFYFYRIINIKNSIVTHGSDYISIPFNSTLYMYITNNLYDKNGHSIIVFLYKNILYGVRRNYMNSYCGTIELIG